MSGPGTWGDIGGMPRWYVRWFMGMGEPAIPVATKLDYYYSAFLGNAHAGTNGNWHFRESRTGTPFCADCTDSTTDEIGRVVSIVANPTNTVQDGITNQFPTTVTGCLSGQPCERTTSLARNGWSSLNENDYSHSYPFAYAVALETGSRYWLEELMFQAAKAVAGSNP